MILYFIKTVLCSTILLGFYFLFLEKEKMHRFSRFYLLLSIVASFIIPAIIFKEEVVAENIFIKNVAPVIQNNLQPILQPSVSSVSVENNLVLNLLIACYGLIVLLLIVRFIKNLYAIIKIAKANKNITTQNATLVLVKEQQVSFSFLKYIFINKDAYENNDLETEVLQHELTHVTQKHSLDIIFIETLLLFAWINPIFFLYKNAIKLNHEFLADEAVVVENNNPTAYQYLLLKNVTTNNSLAFSSSFNYLITKKRLIMITKKTNKIVIALKQIAVLPMFIGLLLLLSEKTTAQVKPAETKTEEMPVGEGATPELLHEYDSTVAFMTTTGVLKNGKKYRGIDMSKGNQDRLAYIFKQMNKEQRDIRIKTDGVSFTINMPNPTKKSPTSEELFLWKNAKIYGVWIDGKRIANSELSNYKPTDFVLYYNSKLSKNAYNYGRHYYQIDFSTEAYYNLSWPKK